ncbi:MAG: hypothetical protein QOD24_1488 [Solirubrobacteraceae bacterium]|jgi:hypothetical protein|nr:hypothetical protein [Solirubrobacteraceae bacterium]
MSNLIDRVNCDDRLRDVAIADEQAQSFPAAQVAPVLATSAMATITVPATAVSFAAVTVAG